MYSGFFMNCLYTLSVGFDVIFRGYVLTLPFSSSFLFFSLIVFYSTYSNADFIIVWGPLAGLNSLS